MPELTVMNSSDFMQYKHHGHLVWVSVDLQGCHRDFCLCWRCGKFSPGHTDNCAIAQELYEFCVKHNTVTPVWECPNFVYLGEEE